MKYTLWVNSKKVQYLTDNGLEFKECGKDNDLTQIELTINRPHDLMYLFQAGVEYGCDLAIKIRREIA
jgi:hypothetical protein